MQISWLTKTDSNNSASYRMRVLIPAIKLQEYGLVSKIFKKKIPISIKSDFIVLSKYYDEKVLQNILSHIEKHNTKVILDICDNQFSNTGTPNSLREKARNQIDLLLKYIHCITVPSVELKRIFIETFNYPQEKVFIVEDCIDSPEKFTQVFHPNYFFSNLIFLFFKNRINKYPQKNRFIWFGAAGKHGGLGIDALINNVNTINKAITSIEGSTLTIVSNSYNKYSTFKKLANFKTFYIPWDNSTAQKILRMHNILLLPSAINNMTLGKSANRLITALSNGLVVVGDMLPSYSIFSDYIQHPFNYENIILAHQKTENLQRPIKSILFNFEESILLEWTKIFKTL